MKQYVGIIRDHSGSMGAYRLGAAAARDYNSIIQQLKSASQTSGVDTIVSVVKCGAYKPYTKYGEPLIDRIVTNSSVNALQPMTEAEYDTRGGNTPLFDSVGNLIELFKQVPDYNDPNVSFLIMPISDGEDNESPKWKSKIAGEIKELQASDKWTFAFRIPKGYRATLEKFGIHPGNIHEWEQTEAALNQASVATTSAIHNFYVSRTQGIRSTRSFYADAGNVSKAQVQANLKDISHEVKIEQNDLQANMWISEFWSKKFQNLGPYRPGAAFYELVKPENVVQDHKMICVRDAKDGKVYSGAAARNLLGLPLVGSIKLRPGQMGDYEVYVQSQSINRYIPLRSKVLIWQGARIM